MANEDFFLSFGSNARSFSQQLIRDLAPAKKEVAALQGMLDKLETDANGSKAPLLNALQKTAGAGAGGGRGQSAYGLDQIHEAVTDFRKDMGDLSRELKTIVAGIRASQGARGRVARGDQTYWDPGVKHFVKTQDVRAGQYPDAFRGGSMPIDPALMRGIAAQAQQGARPGVGQPLKISGIEGVKLDQASFDRVVKAIHEVRDEVRKIAVRPVAGGDTPAPKTTVAQAAGSTQATATASLEQREAALKRKLAEIRVKADRVAALMAQAGHAVEDNMGEIVAELTQTENAVKSELAKLERETTGMTRAQQSTARQEEARKNRPPDLDEAEYDRRVQMRQRLNLALNEGAFMGSVGTGKGQLQRADLVAMADQLTKMGFATPYTSKTRVPELAQNVVSGRQAMLAQYGPEIPTELQTGRRVVADKVSDAVRSIIASANISAVQAAEEEAAREGIRAARQAGYLPKDPTGRATTNIGEGATSLAGQRISGGIGVPPGMVKGAEYDDQIFKYLQGLKTLQDRSLGRAANLAMDPNYDPYRVNVAQEITGQGDEAREARQAFRALRRATLELDDLADEFQTAAQAIDKNEDFIERATNRLRRAAAGEALTPDQRARVQTDPENIKAARANIERLQTLMSSDKFKGLQEVFEDPTFQEGHGNRQISRAQYMRQIEDISKQDREIFTADAARLAATRYRLAGGTKDTYISDLPGLKPSRRGFDYTSPEGRDTQILKELNQFFRSTQSGLRREGEMLKDAEKTGDFTDVIGQIRKTENAATGYLNRLEKIVGFAPPIEQVLGRPVTQEKNRESEIRRNLQYERVMEERDRKLKPQTPEQLLEGAKRAEHDASVKEAATKKKLTAVENELAAVEKAEAKSRQKLISGLDADARAAFESVEAKHKEATSRLRAADKELRREPTMKADDIKYGARRDPATGAYVDPFKRSELGYDIKDASGTPLGYGRSEAAGRTEKLLDQVNTAERDLAQAEADLAAATGIETTETERLSREKRKLTRELEAQTKAAAAARTRRTEYENELRGVSSKVPDVGTQEQRTAAKEASSELRELAEVLERATAAQRRLTAIRDELKKPGADTAALRAERDAIKGAEGYLSQNEIKAMRKQYHQQLAAGVAAGGAGAGDGGKPPTARAAAGDGDDNNILRQILTVLNNIHRTLQTGVRITGAGATRTQKVDPATGQPVRRQTSTSSLYTGTAGGAAAGGDERALAVAAAAQERVAQRLKKATREQGVDLEYTAEMQRLYTAGLTEHTSRERALAEEKRKSAALTRTQARQALDLSNAKALLDDSARKELADLRKLAAAGASNEKIVEQQARAYAALDRAMAQAGASANDRKFYAQQLLSEANVRPDPRDPSKTVQGPRVTRTEVDEVARSARSINFDGLTKAADEAGLTARDAIAKRMFGETGFWGRIMGSTGAFIVRNFAAGAVFGMTNALQEVIYQGIITESTWIRVSDALEQTGRSAGDLRSSLQDISADYGVALNDVYMTAAGLAGVFEDVGDISSATRIVAQLQAISMGALTAQESMGVLASITAAYRDDLREGEDGLRQVADILTVVQNVIGTNVEVTSEGVGALSGLAEQLKIPLAEMSVYVAQIAKLTNQTGAAAGEQFSRILAAFQGGRGRAALAEALPDSGIEQLLGEGEYGQALQVLMREWDGLSDSQQRNLAVAVAGQRQARAFAALMSDTGKTLEATARAHDANGEAQKRADAIAATLNGRIQRLSANFQNLAQNLMRSGLLNVFGILLGGVNLLLSGLNKFISAMNDITDNNPFLNMLKNWAFGLVGLIAALKLAQVAFTGFRNAYKTAAAGEGVMGAFIAGGRGVDNDRVRLRDTLPTAGAYLTGQSNPDTRRYGSSQRVEDARARLANADVNKEGRARTALLRAEVTAARAANASARGLSAGLGAMATAGVAAQLAMVGAAIALTMYLAESAKRRQEEEDARKSAERYTAEGGLKSPTMLAEEYIGPDSEILRQRLERRSSASALASSRTGLSAVTAGIPGMRGVSNLLGGDFFGFGDDDPAAKWQEYYGLADEQVAKDMAALEEALDKSIAQVDGGRSELQTRSEGGFFDFGALAAELALVAHDALDPAKITIGEAEALAAEVNDEVAAARAEILADDSKSAEEVNDALAQLEEIQHVANEKVTQVLLLARGMQEIDILSSDQIKQLDEIRPLLQQIQAEGININDDLFGAGLQGAIEQTGVPDASKVGGILRVLGEGGLSRIDAMKQDRKILEEQYKSAQARYLAAVSGETAYDEEQISEFESVMLAKLGELISSTEAMIMAVVQESTTLAEFAATQGRYGRAAAAIDAGLAEIAGLRDRASESPELRAQRDLLESQQSQKGAEYRAQEKNTRLQMAQAQSGSSQRDAALEARITQNSYMALVNARKAAQAVGAQGPPMAAIRAAKIAWINAELSLTQQAQAANIAAMTAAAASLWNGIAVGQAQEAIALQQYNDAVTNAGAGSAEALNALAGYTSAQHSTQQTMDQVAQATRDAVLASIPQGNAVRIAQVTLSHARAALAAAAKYGHHSVEYQSALAQVYSAQQALVQAEADAALARIGVTIALAEAAGNTVKAAFLQLKQARAALRFALRRSGGANSAEVAGARAEAISAQAALRDAKLQDDLDTIDFNLEMGRITQASAIAALREILRTRDLTKQQRRDLLLQIKGMQEEMSEGIWNFGDIDLPKPYLMKRYIEQRKRANQAQVDARVGALTTEAAASSPFNAASGAGAYNDNRNIEIVITGGNERRIREIFREMVGKPARTRTAASRRGRR